MQINSNYHWVVTNGSMQEADALNDFPLEQPLIYEVIRLIDGKPLFYQEHMLRLCESAKILGISIETHLEAITLDINRLIEQNVIESDNLKLVIGNLGHEKAKWIVYGIKGFYPPNDWFEMGVETKLMHVSRENPHAKVLNQALTEQVDALRKTSTIFEVLLVDEENRITEGSRSNVFFIQGETLIVPKMNLALKGITRQKILFLAEKMGVSCKEVDIYTGDLPQMDGVFVTGTSIDLLPIASIGDLTFESSQLPLMKRLLSQYRHLMSDSLSQYVQK
jgi:branched-chain amino acid aminotransferase